GAVRSPGEKLGLACEPTHGRPAGLGLVPNGDAAQNPAPRLDHVGDHAELAPVSKNANRRTGLCNALAFAEPERPPISEGTLVAIVAGEFGTDDLGPVLHVFFGRFLESVRSVHPTARVRRIRDQRVDARVGQTSENGEAVSRRHVPAPRTAE